MFIRRRMGNLLAVGKQDDMTLYWLVIYLIELFLIVWAIVLWLEIQMLESHPAIQKKKELSKKDIMRG